MTTDSEETLFLSSKTLIHEEVYQRFTPARKRWIVVIVSVTGLLPLTRWMPPVGDNTPE
ncbi:hypothetical protein BYT27DRAFT_7261412 [Phlegmacium glaucopus]|nr:hypothetical protein BYT27DRAFT_7261412 [Phlegmacium glaucopus]